MIYGNYELTITAFPSQLKHMRREVANTEVTLSDVVDILKKIDKNKNERLCAKEMSEAFEDWLGITLSEEDVDGIFNAIQPMALENDEIEMDAMRQSALRSHTA